jgi:hypothetical protein
MDSSKKSYRASHHDQCPQIDETQMAKKLKRRAWPSEDIRSLKRLARKKMPAAAIARLLKRTEVAIRQKAFSLRLSLDTRSKPKSTALGRSFAMNGYPTPSAPQIESVDD